MDEVGSAIEHSEAPNAAVFPFLFAKDCEMNEQVAAYSLLMPIRDILPGETICRDFLPGCDEAKQRTSRSWVWFSLDENEFLASYNKKVQELTQLRQASIAA